MPTRLPSCPHCRNNLFVRAEMVLSGRRVSKAYYCGRCNYEWRVESTPPAQIRERRGIERRKQQRLEEKVRV
jgi:hypothetical protein